MIEVKAGDRVFVYNQERRRIIECHVDWSATWHMGVSPIDKPGQVRTLSRTCAISKTLADLLVAESQCSVHNEL